MSNGKNNSGYPAKLAAQETAWMLSRALAQSETEATNVSDTAAHLAAADADYVVQEFARAITGSNSGGNALLENDDDDDDAHEFFSGFNREVKDMFREESKDGDGGDDDNGAAHDPQQHIENLARVANKYLDELLENDEEVSSDEVLEAFETPGNDEEAPGNVAADMIASNFLKKFGSSMDKQMAEKAEVEAAGSLSLDHSPLSNDNQLSIEARDNVNDVSCYMINQGLLQIEDAVNDYSIQAKKSLEEYSNKKERKHSSNNDNDNNGEEIKEDEPLEHGHDDYFYEGLVHRHRGAAVLQRSIHVARRRPKIFEYAKRAEKVAEEIPEKLKQLVEEGKKLSDAKENKENEAKEGDEDKEEEEKREEIRKRVEEMSKDLNETEGLSGPGDAGGTNGGFNGSSNNEHNNHNHYHGNDDYYGNDDDNNDKEGKNKKHPRGDGGNDDDGEDDGEDDVDDGEL